MNIKIPEQISSVFSKVEGKNRYYVFVGILFVVFLLDYFLLMSPQLSSLKKINPEIRTLSENIKKAKADIDKLLSCMPIWTRRECSSLVVTVEPSGS